MALYEACGQAFVGCPGDAEQFQELLQHIWADLSVPGLKPVLIHWKKDFDAHASTSAVPAQFQIARTSDPATNPVFILFAQTIGTAVRPPPEGWSELRHWLDSNGWPFIALLGEADFHDPGEVPDGKIPLSGTLYEMFDAMRSGGESELIIYDLRHWRHCRRAGRCQSAATVTLQGSNSPNHIGGFGTTAPDLKVRTSTCRGSPGRS